MWWFEIVPCICIMGTLMSIPQIAAYHTAEWLYGNPMRRDLTKEWDLSMFERDNCLTGKYYVKKGMEEIPDMP